MDLLTARAHDGHKWSWTRNGALILFLVTGILLVTSLAHARQQSAATTTSLLATHIPSTSSPL